MRLLIPLLRYYEIVGVVSYGVGCNSTINGENVIVELLNVSLSQRIQNSWCLQSGEHGCGLDNGPGWDRNILSEAKDCRISFFKAFFRYSKESLKFHCLSNFNDRYLLPVWGSWQAWSACDRTCGVGRKSRVSPCLGRSCPPKGHTQKTQEILCNTKAEERRICLTPKLEESASLKYFSGTDIRHVFPARVILILFGFSDWGSWQAWSTCDRSCGVGRKIRTSYCLGKRCRPRGHTRRNQELLCNVHTCS